MLLVSLAVVPGYYLVCYNSERQQQKQKTAVVPGYYLVCYNDWCGDIKARIAVVPGYYLVCYNTQMDRILYQML